jgi:hypothetical protein
VRYKVFLAFLLAPLLCQASITFDFQYGTGSGYWTADRKSALNSAANTLASYLNVASPVTLTFDVTGFSTSGGSLASAGSGISTSAGFNKTTVQRKIQTGVDQNGATADGTINWNFYYNWDTDDSISAGYYDFKAVATHELLHAFGFMSLIDSAGNNSQTYWSAFDDFVMDSGGNPVINDGTYVFNTAYNTNLTGGNGGLYFGGANAVAAFGALVPLYTPGTWSGGSSVSHLDTTYFTGANKKVMNHAVSSGPAIRTLSAIELGILEDIGYSLASAAVPEPSTWLMSLVACGGVVITLARRRKTASGPRHHGPQNSLTTHPFGVAVDRALALTFHHVNQNHPSPAPRLAFARVSGGNTYCISAPRRGG